MARPIAGLAARVTALDRLLEIEARLEARLEAAGREGEVRELLDEREREDHPRLKHLRERRTKSAVSS
jgi:hypothetical protein